jgi:hypothetical protein
MNRSSKISFLVILLLFFSCRKDFERPNWDVDLLAPLVKTSLTLDNLLPDSVLITNPDTSLKIVYQTSLFDIDMDSIFRIPDTNITEIFSFPISTFPSPGDAFYSTDKETTLGVSNGVQLNLASIESGRIELEIWSEIKEKVIITYTIPIATKNGDTLILQELIPAGTTSQAGYFTTSVDISGYELDLTGISKTKVNTFVTRAVGRLDTLAAGPVVVQAGEKITISNKLIGVVPSYVRGFFGNQQYHFGPETTDFNAFSRILAGTLDLNQVDVNLSFENGIGVDAQITLNQLAATNTKNASTISLTHPIIGNSLNINRALQTFSVPEVNYTYLNTLISTSNSNIDQLIEIFPNQLLFDINLHINPFGNLSGNNDFVFKNHPLKANLNVEFPLSIIANNLTLVDTIDIDLDKESSSGQILNGDLVLFADNGFPFNAAISLQLFDAFNQPLSIISSPSKIEAAPLNSNLRVTSKQASMLRFSLTNSTINDLYNAKKIAVKVSFTTIGQPQFVKIYEGYNLDLKIVGDFTYNVNLK